jgi:hypothetical protein
VFLSARIKCLSFEVWELYNHMSVIVCTIAKLHGNTISINFMAFRCSVGH